MAFSLVRLDSHPLLRTAPRTIHHQMASTLAGPLLSRSFLFFLFYARSPRLIATTGSTGRRLRGAPAVT